MKERKAMKLTIAQITTGPSARLRNIGALFSLMLICCGWATAQKWNSPATPPQFNVGIALQLTDGRIMIQEAHTFNWWALKPNEFGIYRLGTWQHLKSFPTSWGYSPTYFASAVLKDGRVIIEGGENNNGKEDWTSFGAIYNPVNNTWTKVNPPAGWTHIGDAQSVVLPDGTFMLGNCGYKGDLCSFPQQQAWLDEATLTWTVLGTGKTDGNDEEGWTLLPNGKVLTVDTYLGVPYDPNGTNSELFDPTTKAWSLGPSTVQQLWDSRGLCGQKGETYEVGPAILRPEGTVFATGANTCPSSPGHTAIYDPVANTWTAGPDFLGENDMADAPAAILPNGNVLVETNQGYGKSPTSFYEFDGTGWNSVPQPPGISGNSEGGRMLVTPTGSILLTHVATPQMWFYTTAGTYQSSWRPHICTAPGCFPPNCVVGKTYTVKGTQFNGLTQGAAFGDDAQSATNYPLVQITNNATHHKFFARTHGFSTMGVATGSTPTSTKFTILPTSEGTEFGDSTMVVIANGIPSNTVGIVVKQSGD
jgi:hypothetical protein